MTDKILKKIDAELSWIVKMRAEMNLNGLVRAERNLQALRVAVDALDICNTLMNKPNTYVTSDAAIDGLEEIAAILGVEEK